ncbi:helix-turn-helix domain-containing protein [Peribacillus sp. NPDC097284]|uniref:helix-turn-helix domain-containing protein n=1 Tax=unclassified Peribacillus TaxID=2675266 RepID=UPI003815635D
MDTVFKPIQPEWNQRLQHINLLEPTLFLKSSVAYVYQFKVSSNVEPTVLLPGIPDGCVDIIFNMEGDQGDCFLIPSPKIRQAYSFKTNTTYFGIRSLPLQTLFSFVLSMKEINQYIQLALFEVAPSFSVLYNQLLEISTLKEKLHTLESFLLSNCTSHSPNSAIVKCCMDISIRSKGNIHVKDFEAHTGYSERYLRTLFQNEVGIPPKLFLELLNFQYTLQEIYSGTFNLETHIAESGSYDTSHFYKKFKKFTQMTPFEYRKLLKEVIS